jgi:hypothetical protein
MDTFHLLTSGRDTFRGWQPPPLDGGVRRNTLDGQGLIWFGLTNSDSSF